jgi:ergothioneine biosynthesis protein EgtB
MRELLGALAEGQHAGLASVVEVGLQHEQQHQELILTDVKHMLAQNPLRPALWGSAPPSKPAALRPPLARFVPFDAGVRWIGHAGQGFAFDNEAPRHRVFAEAFALADRPVTCADYLAFMEDGGYERPDLWLSDGWDAAQREGWEAPLYWERQGDGWQIFTLHGLRDVDPAEPVCHVSHYEADAFARWAGARLPTEAEWEIAAGALPIAGCFAESGRYHPAPAPPGGGLGGMLGDTWEWTSSAYGPYPGYHPWEGSLGEYNGKFMSGQMVLRGGSCFTPASHARATYRNFFPPAARWQMTGIRLARSA